MIPYTKAERQQKLDAKAAHDIDDLRNINYRAIYPISSDWIASAQYMDKGGKVIKFYRSEDPKRAQYCEHNDPTHALMMITKVDIAPFEG
jgi:hypothetical protein